VNHISAQSNPEGVTDDHLLGLSRMVRETIDRVIEDVKSEATEELPKTVGDILERTFAYMKVMIQRQRHD